MKRLIIIVLCATVIHAGRTSQWSSTFILKEPINTILNGHRFNEMQNRFDMSVLSGPGRKSALIYVSGISPDKGSSLHVYGVNGKLVANLSGLVHPGSSVLSWNAPVVPAGMFFARLQSGGHVKIVKFIVSR